MSIACLFISGLLLFILQTTIFQTLSGWTAMLNPVFVLFVFSATRMKLISGAILTLFFALLLDICFGLFPGLYPVIYLSLFFALRQLHKIIVVKENPHKIILVLISFIFVYFFSFIFINLVLPDNSLLSRSWINFIVQFTLLSLIAVPIFNFFEIIMERLNSPGKLNSWKKRNKNNRFRN